MGVNAEEARLCPASCVGPRRLPPSALDPLCSEQQNTGCYAAAASLGDALTRAYEVP